MNPSMLEVNWKGKKHQERSPPKVISIKASYPKKVKKVTTNKKSKKANKEKMISSFYLTAPINHSKKNNLGVNVRSLSF